MDFSSKKFSIHFKNPRKKVGQANRLEIFGTHTWNTWQAMVKNEILTQRDDEDEDDDDDDGSV